MATHASPTPSHSLGTSYHTQGCDQLTYFDMFRSGYVLDYLPHRGGYRIYERGAPYIKCCRRKCIEACSADQSARSAEIFFRLHFSLLRMGSCGTFALCTASSRCTRIAGPRPARATMSFFLAQISLTNVIRTYTEGYTRSWSRSQAVWFQAMHDIAS